MRRTNTSERVLHARASICAPERCEFFVVSDRRDGEQVCKAVSAAAAQSMMSMPAGYILSSPTNTLTGHICAPDDSIKTALKE